MRTIKFRGLMVDGKGWVYGYLFKDEGEFYIQDYHSDFQHDYTVFEVISESVGQFTGLTDKNGVEIYEGDIVLCKEATEPEDLGFICQLKNYRWEFNNVRFPDDDSYGTVDYTYIIEYCEVIGNIHQQ